MPIAATSYESNVSEAIVGMLAASTAFQAVSGGGNATATRAQIIEDWGGLNTSTASNGSQVNTSIAWAVLALGATQVDRRALDTYGRSGEASLTVVLPATTGDNAPDSFRRARNLQGLICAQMTALCGSAGALVSGLFQPGQILRDDSAGEDAADLILPINIAWNDL